MKPPRCGRAVSNIISLNERVAARSVILIPVQGSETMKVNDTYLEERIVARVRDLIVERGVSGWNMDGLASDAGVAKNTLYKIVRSKEEVVSRVVLDHVRRAQGELVKILEKRGDYDETVAELIARFPRLMDSALTRRMGEIFREFPAVEAAVRTHQDRLTAGIMAFFQEGIDRGIIRDDVSPEFLLDLFRAVILFNLTSGATGDILAERLEKSLRCVAYGIRK
jgi:AcrR family transcriptional regulator